MVWARRLGLVVILCAAVAVPVGEAAAAQATPPLIPPVDAAVARHFEPPASPYGAGHRGIDYAVPSGTPVRAAAAGVVSFAGPVAGALAVTVAHEGALETTYTFLEEISVARGDVVGQGHWLGLVGHSHRDEVGGLHFGVKLHGDYVDPLEHLGPLDVSRALHLAPLMPDDAPGAVPRSCLDVDPLAQRTPPPNDNVAVTVAGVASHTVDGSRPALYRRVASGAFGYPRGRVYSFSYRGIDGPRAHTPYGRTDTYGDLVEAARDLRLLLAHIGRVHPNADVDLLAHSQGGIVARALLELLVDAWDPALPRVDHVVTFATPHLGAPLAALPRAVEAGPVGRIWSGALSALARRGWVSLPVGARNVDQLAPGADLLEALAREDVLYGARLLSLVMAHDLVVPADRARVGFETNRVVAPQGVWGHSSLLRSERARALAYAFLRDAPQSCIGTWDRLGPLVGRAVGAAQAAAGWLLGAAGRVPLPGFPGPLGRVSPGP